MNLCKITKLGTIGAVAALLAMSQTTATAQVTQRTLTRTTGQSQDGGHHAMTFQTTKDGRDVMVEMRDGEVVSATVDGEEIPRDRITTKDGRIVIVDEDGGTIFEMNHAGGHGAHGGAWVVGPNQQLFTAPGAWGGVQGMEAAQAEPPPVMMGVSLAEPDRGLRRHFGLEEGKATMLLTVYDGLPAAEAGLKAFDVVVSVNGDDDAGQAELREALRDAEPGDTLTLGVIQGGERKQVRVKLAKYDRERLNEAAQKFREEHGNDEDGLYQFYWPSGEGQQQFFQGLRGTMPEQMAEEMRKRFEGEQGQRMRELQREQGARARELRNHLERSARDREALTEERARLRERRPDGDGEQIDRLEDRLDRLERLLEKLAEEKAAGKAGG